MCVYRCVYCTHTYGQYRSLQIYLYIYTWIDVVHTHTCIYICIYIYILYIYVCVCGVENISALFWDLTGWEGLRRLPVLPIMQWVVYLAHTILAMVHEELEYFSAGNRRRVGHGWETCDWIFEKPYCSFCLFWAHVTMDALYRDPGNLLSLLACVCVRVCEKQIS